MIRITYANREYTLQPDDHHAAPLRFAPRDNAAWVNVLDSGGLRIDVLSGGAKQALAAELAQEGALRD